MYPSNQPCPSAPPASLGIPIGTAGPYYNQPQPQMIVYQPPVKWSTGLCGCADDCGSCCMTLWCPCVTFGRVAEIVDRGSTSCGASGALYELILCFTGLQWIYSCTYRSKMRAQYNLASSPCNDCCVHFCCEYCALCQEYRELKNRGYDLTVGWQPNMERQAQRATLPPPTQPGMMR